MHSLNKTPDQAVSLNTEKAYLFYTFNNTLNKNHVNPMLFSKPWCTRTVESNLKFSAIPISPRRNAKKGVPYI